MGQNNNMHRCGCDGFQIRTLILAMIYRLIPTLIKEGKVFIAESPCLRLTQRIKPISLRSEKKRMILTK